MTWIGLIGALALIFVVWRLARRAGTAPTGRARRAGRGDDSPVLLSASVASDTGGGCGHGPGADAGCSGGSDGGGGGGGGD